MADITLHAAPILGTDLTLGNNRITERDDLALVSVAIPLDGEDTLEGALKQGWSLPLPSPNLSATDGETRAMRTAPDQILLLFPHARPDANAHVQARLNGAGYTTDQTDAWIVLELSGPETLPALERICPLDLNTSVFPTGACARTVMEHMGAIILRLDDDRVLLLSARSTAASFLHAVETSFTNVLT